MQGGRLNGSGKAGVALATLGARRADDSASSAPIRAIFDSFRLGADAAGDDEAAGGNRAR